MVVMPQITQKFCVDRGDTVSLRPPALKLSRHSLHTCPTGSGGAGMGGPLRGRLGAWRPSLHSASQSLTGGSAFVLSPAIPTTQGLTPRGDDPLLCSSCFPQTGWLRLWPETPAPPPRLRSARLLVFKSRL